MLLTQYKLSLYPNQKFAIMMVINLILTGNTYCACFIKNTGQTERLRIDREQIPSIAQVLRDLDGLRRAVRDRHSAHRTDHIRTALIGLETPIGRQ